MPQLKSKPFNRKMKNVCHPASELSVTGQKRDYLPELGVKKCKQSHLRKRKKAVSRVAMVKLRLILHEEQSYKLLFGEFGKSGDDDARDVYKDFIEMIGGFEARSRVVSNSPFSTRPKPREQSINRDFPELESLLKNLPNHRFSSQLKKELLSISENADPETNIQTSTKIVVKDVTIHRNDCNIEIEEYPAYQTRSKCEEDIADVTAGIDLLAIPKSMSSMAESMYS